VGTVVRCVVLCVGVVALLFLKEGVVYEGLRVVPSVFGQG